MSRRRSTMRLSRPALGLALGALVVLLGVAFVSPIVQRVIEAGPSTSSSERYAITDTTQLAARLRAAGVDCLPLAEPEASLSVGVVESVRCGEGRTGLHLAVHESRAALFDGIELVIDGLGCLVLPPAEESGPVGLAASFQMVHDERWSIVLHDAPTAQRIAASLGAALTAGSCGRIPSTGTSI